jgi:hypothetical protein
LTLNGKFPWRRLTIPGNTPVPTVHCLQTCLWCDHGVYRPVSKDNVWLLVDATPQK